MKDLGFKEIEDFLKEGREIEFIYQHKQYSITNSNGYWYLCCDTEGTTLEKICLFEEKDVLVSRVRNITINDTLISDIFNKKLYEDSSLYIL